MYNLLYLLAEEHNFHAEPPSREYKFPQIDLSILPKEQQDHLVARLRILEQFLNSSYIMDDFRVKKGDINSQAKRNSYLRVLEEKYSLPEGYLVDNALSPEWLPALRFFLYTTGIALKEEEMESLKYAIYGALNNALTESNGNR